MLPGKADIGIHSLPAEAVTPADTVGNLMILIAVRQSSIDDRVGTGSFIEPEYILYRLVSVQRRRVTQHELCTLSHRLCDCQASGEGVATCFNIGLLILSSVSF